MRIGEWLSHFFHAAGTAKEGHHASAEKDVPSEKAPRPTGHRQDDTAAPAPQAPEEGHQTK